MKVSSIENMKKKCTICTHDAGYRIKDTADFYCQECAEEHFGDISLLLPLVEVQSSSEEDKEQEDEDDKY